MVFAKMKYVDAFFLILGIILIVARIADTTPLKNPAYVPDAVEGMSAVAGILVGFTGLFLTHMVSTAGDVERKNWLKKRIPYTTFLIGIGLFFVIMAFQDLVYQNDLAWSWKGIHVGLIIITMLFVDTILIPFSES